MDKKPVHRYTFYTYALAYTSKHVFSNLSNVNSSVIPPLHSNLKDISRQRRSWTFELWAYVFHSLSEPTEMRGTLLFGFTTMCCNPGSPNLDECLRAQWPHPPYMQGKQIIRMNFEPRLLAEWERRYSQLELQKIKMVAKAPLCVYDVKLIIQECLRETHCMFWNLLSRDWGEEYTNSYCMRPTPTYSAAEIELEPSAAISELRSFITLDIIQESQVITYNHRNV